MEMMTKLNKHLLIAAVTLSAISGNAKEKYGNVFRTASSERVLSGCSPAQSSAELSVNNVRTIIFSGSDMWWDLFGGGNAYYLVPKVEDRSKGASSNFAGNVWFGGLDVGGQLKIAAQTYRQSGVDFWTGPLSTQDASITSDICNKYDKIFKLKRTEVDAFVLADGPITTNIKDWPGNGDISLNQAELLAPFVDINGDNRYVPEEGDYPYYDVYNNGLKDNLGVCKARVFGDETLWWVYNDNGSNHVATGGKAIGMEIRAQAFAFKTTDEINNMTFYNYQLINRSSFSLLNTYMTVWTDADLGYYGDDYIGCDVQRGLGYIYNADGDDQSVAGTPGYGAYCPALGCDFFQGPINTINGIDDDHDNGLIIPGQLTGIDEPGEQMGMTKFLYFNNSFAGVPIQTTDPQNSTQYYQYMTGFWRDGTPFTCGGNGYGGSVATDYVYPADTYTNGACGAAPWSESGTSGDRRFMQSSGPFELQPGAINYITFGLPWARTTSTDPKASIPLLKIADDKAQALFDNCFRVLSGPEAPDMTIQEMDNELIIYFSNKPASNNYLNQYKELDVSIVVDPAQFPNADKYYHFEGFKVYQLKNNTIVQEELTDPSKAKLVFNCDVQNGVSRLINYEYDATTGGDVPRVKVDLNDNSDKGIKSSFRFIRDEFSGDQAKKVVNNKEYYFYCVAYGYNNYGDYKEDSPFVTVGVASSSGQKRPYLEGRKSKKAFGIPHNPAPEKDGSITNSLYGYGPKITREEGQGNGGNYLQMTQESENNILNSPTSKIKNITYENGRGPVIIKVVDPLNVPNSNFSLKLISRNYFWRPDTLTGSSNATLLNQYINSVIDADPCKTAGSHTALPYPTLSNNSDVYGQVNQDTATWVLKDLTSQKSYYPCKSIKVGEEFYFSELGLSVTIGGANDLANISSPFNTATDKLLKAGDIIGASMTFANANQTWLSGLSDQDGPGAFNWIRSGTFTDGDPATSDYQVNNASTGTNFVFADENQYFENVLGGTWAPYALTAVTRTVATGKTEAAPAFSGLVSASAVIAPVFDLRTLASVDIVFTKDKSKWTRSIVLEQCDEPAAIPTRAGKLETRRHKSVDKQGISLGDPGCNTAEASFDSLPGIPFQTGLSWFPGYAINMETGERLNIAFGEDSYQTDNNGDDMMWNPNHVVYKPTYNYSFGGRHYIYVFGNNRSGTKYEKNPVGANGFVPADLDGKLIGSGTYADFKDFAYTYKWAYQTAITGTAAYKTSSQLVLTNFWSDAMWVNIPLTIDPRYNFKNPADMPGDARASLRVKKAYRPSLGSHSHTIPSLYTQAGFVNSSSALANNVCPTIQPIFPYNASSGANFNLRSSYDVVASPVNNNYNLYTFNTSDIFTELNNADKHKSALDLINIVPNPYYAYSAYESGRIDNRVRITNLPNKCKIKIFTLNGTLVRTFDRDLSGQEDINVEDRANFVHSKRLPYQDWDMKNQSGISVASGLYIIHIDVPDVGEKILKWFGVMRPLDLQSY